VSDISTKEVDVVTELNVLMHQQQTAGAQGLGCFRELLDQSLRFRRASGAIATRDEYLIDLANPQNSRDKITAVGPIECTVYENTAFASVLLRVKGKNAGTPFAGLFRNLRIFHRDAPDKPWRLKVWFNDKVPEAAGKA
jgi:hypothetical protein